MVPIPFLSQRKTVIIYNQKIKRFQKAGKIVSNAAGLKSSTARAQYYDSLIDQQESIYINKALSDEVKKYDALIEQQENLFTAQNLKQIKKSTNKRINPKSKTTKTKKPASKNSPKKQKETSAQIIARLKKTIKKQDREIARLNEVPDIKIKPKKLIRKERSSKIFFTFKSGESIDPEILRENLEERSGYKEGKYLFKNKKQSKEKFSEMYLYTSSQVEGDNEEIDEPINYATRFTAQNKTPMTIAGWERKLTAKYIKTVAGKFLQGTSAKYNETQEYTGVVAISPNKIGGFR